MSTTDLTLPLPASRFASLLLAWYDREKRDLPWRRTRDPYRVWLSEVMLQQTQVTTVIPYYERFLRRYPKLEDLARAQEEQVLDLWAGLGYYRRARSLLQASRIIHEKYQGRFPEDFADAIRLPGIGQYSAGAILSIAFGKPYPVIDGNVRRVMVRLINFVDTIGSSFTRHLWRLLGEVVRDELVVKRVADFNQALMELGSLICRARDPQCAKCPLQSVCRARQTGNQNSIPPVSQRKRRVELSYTSAIVQRRDRFLMLQTEGQIFLNGFWEFPKISGWGCETASLEAFRDTYSLELRFLKDLSPIIHHVTFRRLQFHPFIAELAGPLPPEKGFRWLTVGEPGYPMSAYVRKIEKRLD